MSELLPILPEDFYGTYDCFFLGPQWIQKLSHFLLRHLVELPAWRAKKFDKNGESANLCLQNGALVTFMRRKIEE